MKPLIEKLTEPCLVCKEPVTRSKDNVIWARKWGMERKAYCVKHKKHKQPL